MERTETQRRILEVGKKEFLEKGFKDASLNQIVAEAGFTKGAFYGYYPDKTALFEDLVGETASELLTRFKAAQDDYFDLVPEGRAKDSLALSTQHLHEFVAFMYDHFDEFKLILCRADGTGYADFIEVLVEPMKNTIFINIFATILALGITIPLGIFCAVKRGSRRDVAVQVGTIIGYSLPTFIIAIVFIWLFAVVLGWFPVSGMTTAGSLHWSKSKQFWDKMYHLALPLIVMTFCSLGGMTRYVRAAMIEALSMDCIRTARAKGVREKVVIYSHAWRNALLPIITLIIGWFLGIFGGSVMIENIFGLNGIGKVCFDALNGNDNEVILALQMFYVSISLFGNLIIDLVYGLVDPRIRVNK